MLYDLKTNPITYITRDLERALGIPLSTEGYFIISNSTPFAKSIAGQYTNVLLIENPILLDTHELLEHPQAQTFIKTTGTTNVLVFKNTTTIERICQSQGLHLLNPATTLATRVEEKITQIEWLGDLAKLLPPHQVQIAKEVQFTGTPFIVQFNRAHTGLGTFFVQNQNDLKNITDKFPDRPVRVTSYIKGLMFTSNNVVLSSGQVLTGNISYQITGLSPFTDQPFTTVGNDWGFARTLLSTKQREEYETIVQLVGKKLYADGWHGLFGIDAILSESGQFFLIEINARQPASTTYESELQGKIENKSKNEVSTFAAHLLALLKKDQEVAGLIPIEDGAQIIQRITPTWSGSDKMLIGKTTEQLQALGLNTIVYTNTAPGSDSVRIQSPQSFFSVANTLNDLGTKITAVLLDQRTPKVLSSLSAEAREVIKSYLALTLGNTTVPCPYFNNRRTKVRAGLRVLIGKGSPTEIVEEAEILAKRERVDLDQITAEEVKKFLVDHNLGIDCSGLAYYILAAEVKATHKRELKKSLSLPANGTPLRRLIRRLRFIENISVQTFADDRNTRSIEIKDVQAGDLVVMLGTGAKHDLNHILIIERVEESPDQTRILHYVHSLQWTIDGQYNHGVRRGTIMIKNNAKPLAEQVWQEAGKTGEDNETLGRVKSARSVEIRRIKLD